MPCCQLSMAAIAGTRKRKQPASTLERRRLHLSILGNSSASSSLLDLAVSFLPACQSPLHSSLNPAEMSQDESSRILVEDDGQGVITITINRPEALNALTRPMMKTLAQAIKRIRVEGTARAIILTGAGRAFCSGVDLTAAQTVFQGDVSDVEADPVVQMELCQIPIIGAINGHAVTAGFEIALACDILIASTNAKFVDTHCKFGIFPSWGLSQKLPRLIGGNRAREVSLTAEPIIAANAEKWGLVSRMVPPEELMSTAKKIAVAISRNHRQMVLNYKRVINDGLAGTLKDGRALEKERAWVYYKSMKPEDFQDMQKFIAGRARAKL